MTYPNDLGYTAADYNKAKPIRQGFDLRERDRVVLPALLAFMLAGVYTYLALGLAGLLP